MGSPQAALATAVQAAAQSKVAPQRSLATQKTVAPRKTVTPQTIQRRLVLLLLFNIVGTSATKDFFWKAGCRNRCYFH